MTGRGQGGGWKAGTHAEDMGGGGGSCGSDGSGRRKGEESRAERERRFSGGGRREVSRGLVQVLPLHAAQDKEISRGANADTAACSRRDGGEKKDHFTRESSSHFGRQQHKDTV